MKIKLEVALLSFCQDCEVLRLRDVKYQLQQLLTYEKTILPDFCAICDKRTSPEQSDDVRIGNHGTQSKDKPSPKLSSTVEVSTPSKRRKAVPEHFDAQAVDCRSKRQRTSETSTNCSSQGDPQYVEESDDVIGDSNSDSQSRDGDSADVEPTSKETSTCSPSGFEENIKYLNPKIGFKENIKYLNPKILDMMDRPNTSPFKCKHCSTGKEYRTVDPFLKHIRLAHSSADNVIDEPYKCNTCHKNYAKFNMVKSHLISHQEEKQVACPECGKKFKTNPRLYAHQKIHAPREKILCSVCGACFTTRTSLRQHTVSVHLNLRPFKCEHCVKSFTDRGKMKLHMQRQHRNDRPWMCHLCGKSFKVNDDLLSHSYSHSSVRKYACDVCDYRCKRPEYLRKHRRIHTGEKPYHCEACEMTFSNRTSLVLHQKKHHGGVAKPSGTSPQSVAN